MNNCYTWIKNKLRENNLDKSIEENESTYSKDSYKRKVRLAYEELIDDGEQLEFNEESYVKLCAKNQSIIDLKNVAKKENRENYRLYNILENTYNEYVELLKKIELPKIKIEKYVEKKEDKIGILHLSDLHMNSSILPNESFGNEYNFTIASKRLKKYIIEACKIFDLYNIKTVYIFMTGDLISSNRLLSQQLSMITSQVKASLLTTYLLQQCIIQLAQKYKVYFTNVVGNESRLSEDMDSTSILSSENMDYLIANNLQMIFENKYENVKYIKPENNIQTIVTLENNFNALLLHGHTFKSQGTIDKVIGQLVSNYMWRGIPINGIFYGHYHSASIGDIVSRSSSLCGANAYSANDLMYLSRASQNIYIVNKDLGYNAIKIDLQNIDNINGYPIIEELEMYNI